MFLHACLTTSKLFDSCTSFRKFHSVHTGYGGNLYQTWQQLQICKFASTHRLYSMQWQRSYIFFKKCLNQLLVGFANNYFSKMNSFFCGGIMEKLSRVAFWSFSLQKQLHLSSSFPFIRKYRLQKNCWTAEISKVNLHLYILVQNHSSSLQIYFSNRNWEMQWVVLKWTYICIYKNIILKIAFLLWLSWHNILRFEIILKIK